MSSSARFLSTFILCLWLQIGCCDGAFIYRDCQDLKRLGTRSGVKTVYPQDGKDPIDVYCDQKTDGGGWLVIQRRQDGSEDFHRDWETYLNGFGNLSNEFWLGNEDIRRLTKQRSYQLRVDLEDFENHKRYALYNYFSIGPDTDYYRLFLLGYSGTAGDSLSKHSGSQFSAKNIDKDKLPNKDCAHLCRGGWWYFACHHSNLNGLYLKGKHTSYGNGVNWKTFRGFFYSLKMTEMKIRPMKRMITH